MWHEIVARNDSTELSGGAKDEISSLAHEPRNPGKPGRPRADERPRLYSAAPATTKPNPSGSSGSSGTGSSRSEQPGPVMMTAMDLKKAAPMWSGFFHG